MRNEIGGKVKTKTLEDGFKVPGSGRKKLPDLMNEGLQERSYKISSALRNESIKEIVNAMKKSRIFTAHVAHTAYFEEKDCSLRETAKKAISEARIEGVRIPFPPDIRNLMDNPAASQQS